MYRTEYSIAHRIPETLAPIRIAPASSKMVAITQACGRVNTLAPTDVPNEFATSFAPIPKAKMKATMKPTTTTGIVRLQHCLFPVIYDMYNKQFNSKAICSL